MSPQICLGAALLLILSVPAPTEPMPEDRHAQATIPPRPPAADLLRAAPAGPESSVEHTIVVVHEVRARRTAQGYGVPEEPLALEDLSVWLALPPNTERQDLIALHFEGEEPEVREGERGQRFARWTMPRLLEGESAIFSYRATVRVKAIQTPMRALRGIALQSPIPTRTESRNRYDLAMQALAERARREAASPEDLVLALSAAVLDRLDYELDGRWLDPTATWKLRRGSCSEYSALFVELARRAGLKARTVGGTVLRAGNEGPPIDRILHRWAEVELADGVGFPIDLAGLDGEPTAVAPIALGLLNAATIILSRGEHPKELGRHHAAHSSAREPAGLGLFSDTRVVWIQTAAGNPQARP